nr:F0F1 ATP synthase subunit gamma [uncultured Pseudodesulfovibrio sp.]
MQTLDALQKRIQTTGDLLGVVKTMKSLAAVNIRHFERAARSLTEYAEVVEQGWAVLFRSGELTLPAGRETRALILVVGSDQGMCGQFNELATRAALQEGDRIVGKGLDVAYWSAGDRIRIGLEDAGRVVVKHFSIPGTLGGVNLMVEGLVPHLAEWYRSGQGRFHVVHNAEGEREGYAPLVHNVLPLDKDWEEKVTAAPWPSRCLPQTYLPTEALFAGLFEQHLFASLYGALVRSMAAENAARLAAMQAAENNIEDMRAHLQMTFHQIRQDSITGELLDIVSGFEAMIKQAGR